MPTSKKPIKLDTDGSSVEVGAVEKPIDGDEDVCPLFYSVALNSAHRNYSRYAREKLAVVKASDALRVFLLGRQITQRSDHNAIGARSVSSRVTKWLIELQTFDFAIELSAGKEDVVADSHCRIPWPIRLPNIDTSDDFLEC